MKKRKKGRMLRCAAIVACTLVAEACNSPEDRTSPTDSDNSTEGQFELFADRALADGVRTVGSNQSDLGQVTKLVLQDRGIRTLIGLETLTGLKVLDLSDNEITDIGPLAGLSVLTFLELGGNAIEDVSPLSSLKQLQYLGLLGNNVVDVSPLLGLSSLESVDLTGNPLSASASRVLGELRERGVSVGTDIETGDSQMVLRLSGRIAFMREHDIYVVDLADSQLVNLTDHPAWDNEPCWSPDGRRIAFSTNRDGNWEIYSMASDGSDLINLTNDPGDDREPAWSPDGDRIAFQSTRSGNPDIWAMADDGTNLRNLTIDHFGQDVQPTWSPDGTHLAFSSRRIGHGTFQIYRMTEDGLDVTRVTKSPAWEFNPAWSPDGASIAFDADGDIVVVALESGRRRKVTVTDVTEAHPTWSPDGQKLVFEVWFKEENLVVSDLDGLEQLPVTVDRSLDDFGPSWTTSRQSDVLDPP